MIPVVVDVEADGPAAGLFSMVSFAAVRVDQELKTTFRADVRPISDRWDPESLAISGVTREQHLTYADPVPVMHEFHKWVMALRAEDQDVVFVSDNPAFDWQFLNYYFHAFTAGNPFGHSAKRIGDIYGGLVANLHAGREWRERIVTKATHDPLVDAIGNAEALRSLDVDFNLLGHQETVVDEITALRIHNRQMRITLGSAAKRLNSSESLEGLAEVLLQASKPILSGA